MHRMVHFHHGSGEQLDLISTVATTPTHTQTVQDDPLSFRFNLIDQLVAGFSSRKRAGRKGVEALIIEPGNLCSHDLVKMVKKLVCRNCSQLGRKTAQGRAICSTWRCRTCDVPLCCGGCLVEFHTRHSVV